MKMLVEFEWDENALGPVWMNSENLSILLYTQQNTNKELLRFAVKSNGETPDIYMLAEEAAQLLNLSARTFRILSSRGELPAPTVCNGKKVWLRVDINTIKEELEAL